MINIKKRSGFTLIVTIFSFLLIGAILTATVLSFDTSSDESNENNQQIQAREICIAGLEIMIDHMTKTPADYAPLITSATKPEDIKFSTEVKVPFITYNPDGSILDTEVAVSIEVVGKTLEDSTSILVATATTDYALVEKSVDLEILYGVTSFGVAFKRGNFIN